MLYTTSVCVVHVVHYKCLCCTLKVPVLYTTSACVIYYKCLCYTLQVPVLYTTSACGIYYKCLCCTLKVTVLYTTSDWHTLLVPVVYTTSACGVHYECLYMLKEHLIVTLATSQCHDNEISKSNMFNCYDFFHIVL